VEAVACAVILDLPVDHGFILPPIAPLNVTPDPIAVLQLDHLAQRRHAARRLVAPRCATRLRGAGRGHDEQQRRLAVAGLGISGYDSLIPAQHDICAISRRPFPITASRRSTAPTRARSIAAAGHLTVRYDHRTLLPAETAFKWHRQDDAVLIHENQAWAIALTLPQHTLRPPAGPVRRAVAQYDPRSTSWSEPHDARRSARLPAWRGLP
jgi:hypothetical protein